MIATFEDEPYRAPFSGNVIELCPVGALTSTQYRFEARPWEIQNVPTVCGLCPVGCNISATTREGKVKRILSRNHPEVDEGWLCDKGRFAFVAPARRRPDRGPAAQGRHARFEPLGWERGAGRGRAAAPRGGPAIVTALSGSETVEQAYGAREAPARRARCARRRAARRRCPTGSTTSARRSRRSATRQVVVVLCDEPVDERAPIVDLWIKAARRKGARVLTELPEEKVEGARADHRRRRARLVVRARPRRDGGLLPAIHAERPRRRRRLERRRRRRAGRRRAARC